MKNIKNYKLPIALIICGIILVLISFALPGIRTYIKPIPLSPTIYGDFPAGMVGIPYKGTITVSGAGAYTINIWSGHIPNGLKFSTNKYLLNKGFISGVPDKGSQASYAFVVVAKDNFNISTYKQFEITISPPDIGLKDIYDTGNCLDAVIGAMCVFNNKIYAGTSSGAIFRSDGIGSFEKVFEKQEVGITENILGMINCMTVFNGNGKLYAGTTTYTGFPTNGCIISSNDGSDWKLANKPGFGTPYPPSRGIYAMASHNNYLYAATYNDLGYELWRTDGIFPWKKIKDSSNNNINIPTMAVFNKNIYAAITPQPYIIYTPEVMNSSDGNTWDNKTLPQGCANPVLFQPFKNTLYLFNNIPTKAEIQMVYTTNGSNWFKKDNILQGTNIKAVTNYIDKYIFIGILSKNDANEIYYSKDGAIWKEIPGNTSSYYKNNSVIWSMTIFGDYLYIGTQSKPGIGAHIYRFYIKNLS